MEERIGLQPKTLSLKQVSSLNPYCNGRKNRIFFRQLHAAFPLSLNPYCNGRKNRIMMLMMNGIHLVKCCLNPYCNGRKNRIRFCSNQSRTEGLVLILIVMEERIGFEQAVDAAIAFEAVLILIVMEERIG